MFVFSVPPASCFIFLVFFRFSFLSAREVSFSLSISVALEAISVLDESVEVSEKLLFQNEIFRSDRLFSRMLKSHEISLLLGIFQFTEIDFKFVVIAIWKIQSILKEILIKI